jgi:hypothetical protein
VPPQGAHRSALAAAVLLALAAPAPAQTVDDVVRRYLEARGGLARLHAVQSLRLTGTMELPDVSAPFVLELKRPNKMRTEFTVEGQTGIRAWDGRTAWERLPLPGERPRPMGPEDAAAKGYTIELVGRDRLPGGDTWKLVVRGRDDPPRTMHLDSRSHLVVQTLDRRLVDGREVEFLTEVGDYRSVNGLLFPHRIEVGPKGSSERQRLVIRKVEINPPLDDARFAMPGDGPAAARPVRRTPPVLP